MFWSRQDAAKVIAAAVIFLAIGLLLFPRPASPAPALKCKLGSFERCALRATNLTLARGGYSARATAGRCHLRGNVGVCEMTFDRGAFCATIRIGLYDAAHWIAHFGQPHDCKTGPPA